MAVIPSRREVTTIWIPPWFTGLLKSDVTPGGGGSNGWLDI